jgi:hypothetical protein
LSKDADVVSEDFQQQESATSPVGASVDDFSAEAFDHRVDGFSVPFIIPPKISL